MVNHWSKDLLLVECAVVADVVFAFELLHVVDFGARDLVSVLNGALALLLVDDRLRKAFLHGDRLRSLFTELVPFECVLVTHYRIRQQRLDYLRFMVSIGTY